METIEVGDKVSIDWEQIGSEFELEVLYKPCATGDSWHLKRTDGTILYVSSFGRMVRDKERQE